MNFQGRYEDTDTAEIITLIGTEADGTLRVRYFDGTEDVMPQAVLDYQFTQVDEDDFDDEWTAEDEARIQRWRAERQRQLDLAHAKADLEWLRRTGRPMPGCGCPDRTEQELVAWVASLR
jgi:hypothetical protein